MDTYTEITPDWEWKASIECARADKAEARIAELEAALRPAEGLPTFRAMIEHWFGVKSLYELNGADLQHMAEKELGIYPSQFKQLCISMKRHFVTGVEE